MQEPEIANFFWHGELTKLELTSVNSFVRNGFQVNFWSYNGIQIPNCNSMDARDILPESHLKKYFYNSYDVSDSIKRLFMGKCNNIYDVIYPNNNMSIDKKPSLAAFADVFRIKMLQTTTGWWFDTDCICIKDQSNFKLLRKNRKFVAALEDKNTVCLSAFYMDEFYKTKLLNHLDDILSQYKTNEQGELHLGYWGTLGPKMITNFFKKNNIQPINKELFYPLSYHDMKYFINAEYKNDAIHGIRNSLIVHVWDSVLQKNNFDKNNAPKDTLLEYLYNHGE